MVAPTALFILKVKRKNVKKNEQKIRNCNLFALWLDVQLGNEQVNSRETV